MNIGTILLILRSPLLRDALTQILRDRGVTMVHEASDLGGALSLLRSMGNERVDLAVLDAAQSDPRATAVGLLKQESRQTRVVLLGEQIDSISSNSALAADGVLTFDITADMMIRSLQLIQAGERVVPRELMQSIAARAARGSDEPAAPAKAIREGRNQLPSRREAEILQRLLQGHSNKTIARELGITETTVKVHLKSLLRKINASNRTQAAIWAMNNGYSPSSGSPSMAAGAIADGETRPPPSGPPRSRRKA